MSDIDQRIGPYRFIGGTERHHVITVRDERAETYQGTTQLVLTGAQILEVMAFFARVLREEK